ncbi:MAG: hypothetical protein SPG03_00685 [Veillonella caviae]|uniref:hypothetical protein n=1 Tax=Veillonella caviae TaxID=248316 RepID=UPI002A90D7FF|nr:hypothetical protein [Veillonella caviae]MDY5480903.1 hypothetical protein [Veillonella caviae]
MIPVEHNIQVYQGECITLTIGCDSVVDAEDVTDECKLVPTIYQEEVIKWIAEYSENRLGDTI